MLRSADARQLRADTDAIHELCIDGLFEIEKPSQIRLRGL